MNIETFGAYKSLIRSMLAVASKKQTDKKVYDNTKFTAWGNRAADKLISIKKTHVDFAFDQIPAVTVEFYTYAKDNNYPLDGYMTNFLAVFGELDVFDDCEELENLRDHYLGFNDLTMGLANVSLLDGSGAAILHTRVADKIVIDKLTGKEEDVPEWFNDFSRLAVGASWTQVICGQKVSQYLDGDALNVWKQMPANQNDFDAVKAHLIDQFKPLVDFMTQFCTRKQKNGESVLQFGLALKHLSKVANVATNTVLVQRLFWDGLSLEIRKLVVSSKPGTLDEAIAVAREAEKLVVEPQVLDKVIFEVNSITSDNRDMVPRGRSTTHDHDSRKRFSSRHSGSSQSSRDRRSNRNSWHRSPGPRRRSRTPGDVVCYKCQQRGHMARECRNERVAVTCYKCRKTGHIARNCSKN